jgi:cation diffusion facilitator family transporter
MATWNDRTGRRESTSTAPHKLAGGSKHTACACAAQACFPITTHSYAPAESHVRFGVRSFDGYDSADVSDRSESSQDESTTTIVVAVLVNVLIAVCKIAAAMVTGSSAMLSESIHSGVDALNEALLFVGVSRGRRPADESHPLGHGQELYFWTLIVAVVIFGAGGSVSIFEGILRLLQPRALENAVWSYAVLGISLVLETVSWIVAYRALRNRAGSASTWRVIRESKDPTVFTVLLEDTAALCGLTIALAGTIAQQHGLVYADGTASIGIGIVLCCVAFIVIRESRGLIVGEGVADPVRNGIARILAGESAIEHVDSIITLHLGPDNVLLVLSLEFAARSGDEIGHAVERIRDQIAREYPIVTSVSLSLSSLVPRPDVTGGRKQRDV